MIVNLFLKKKRESPGTRFTELVIGIARELSISLAVVLKTLNPYNDKNNLITSAKTDNQPLSYTDKIAIRQIVYDMYYNEIQPTIDNVLRSVNNDNSLPNYTKSIFYKLLKKSLYFNFFKQSNENIVIESKMMTNLRRNYLRKIKKCRKEKRKIYYLKEAWIDLDEIKKGHIHFDLKPEHIKSETPVKNKNILLIICICCDSGFLPSSFLIEELCKPSTGVPEISKEVFINWFEQLLPNLENNCIIVMEKKPNYMMKLEQIPDMRTSRIDIINWLEDKNITINEDMVKIELLQIVEMNKHYYDNYLVNEMVRKHQMQVLWIPPYHDELNLMEIMLPQLLKQIKKNAVKFENAFYLCTNSIFMLDQNYWIQSQNYLMQKERYFWDLDDVIDDSLVGVIDSPSSNYNVHYNSSDSSDYEL